MPGAEGTPALLSENDMKEQTIAITSTFTSEPIAEGLDYLMGELGIPATVKFAPYNQVFQELLSLSSLLSTNRNGVNLILIRLEDWAGCESGAASVNTNGKSKKSGSLEQNVEYFLSTLKEATARFASPCIVCVCPPSPTVAADSHLSARIARLEGVIESELADLHQALLIKRSDLEAIHPISDYYDPISDKLGHIPYNRRFFATLATGVARRISVLKVPAYKVIVLDCDQTLWRGVCGEDGTWGVVLTSGHEALQHFIVAQHDAGMLVCLASRNNEADIEAMFAERTDMPLRADHIVSRRINWKPKSDNLKSLSAELNLGLDSFIFIDDDPAVCAEVEANCPDVLTLRLPDRHEEIPGFLSRIWAFDHVKVTDEDRKRAGLYRQNAQREQLRSQISSTSEFLPNLLLNVVVSPMKSGDVARVAQLTQRTNQFNFTTLRRTESEVGSLIRSGDFECLVVKVSDRFGDYGLVGVIIFSQHSPVIDVDTFLLSCRALGRGVEHVMLGKVAEIASSRGCHSVNVQFIPSNRNQPALEFLERVGRQFKVQAERGSGYLFPCEAACAIAARPDIGGCEAPESAGDSGSSRESSVGGTSRPASEVLTRIFIELSDPEKLVSAIDSHKQRTRESSHTAGIDSQDPVEVRISRIFEAVLGVRPIGPNDDFFDLGGTSVIGVRLFSEIEKATGVTLPLVTLLRATTVRNIADALKNHNWSEEWSSLVPIQPYGSKPPFFCVHAAGGNVLFYRDLARHLDADRPFYGLQLQGLDGKRMFHSTVEEMAAHYITEMRKIEPQGPYFIGGACFGGLVAFEMAQQLRRAGHSVALVAMFDTSGPGYPRLRPSTRALRLTRPYRFVRRIQHHLSTMRLVDSPNRRSYFEGKSAKAVKLVKRRVWKAKRSLTRTLYKVSGWAVPTELKSRDLPISRAQRLYKYELYPGRITLFRATKQPLGIYPDSTMGWNGLAAEGVDVRDVSGYHGTIVVDPRARLLAAELEKCIEAVTSGSDSILTGGRYKRSGLREHISPHSVNSSWLFRLQNIGRSFRRSVDSERCQR